MRAIATRTFVALTLAIGLAAAFAGQALADPPDRFEPPAVVLTLQAGQSATVDKTLHLTGLPAKADIIVAIDATSSMGAALLRAQTDAAQICTDVQTAIPGARFAAVEFEDYPFSPYGIATDDPYELRTLGYTADCATFSAGIGAMVLGNGADLPESNNRVHFEAYSDSVLLGSRDPEASRFLVMLADNVPHSTVAFGDCPSTGIFSDPGRNGVNESGAGDDIETPAAIAGLNADDHTLLYISYNRTTAHPCHTSLATATGGVAVPESAADDIGAFIIANAALVPYTVSLQVSAGCQIGLAFSPPPPYGPFTGPSHPTFTETITAPTVPGNYTCTVTAVRTPGGATTAEQIVIVNVTPGPPFTLELTPETDTNTAGDQHCVTALVRDQFGNPTPGIVVNFAVSGANTNGGAGLTDANGRAVFCYMGTVTGLDNITATAVGGTFPRDTATKRWVPAAPFTLVLTPATDTNTVDDEHCVTATVEDTFGNPTPGITVRFSVTGSVTTSGSATTDAAGQAEFCYTGPGLPGADVITAYADTNNNGVRDAGEPQGTATKAWVIAASTEGCKVTYGGRITAANGDKATFGGNAKADGLKGQQEYQDHGPAADINVHSIDVTSVTCSTDGKSASIFGTATVNGSGTFNYRIDLKDLAEPGDTDTYRIRLSNGYDSGEQVLEGGNVQIH